MAWAMCQAADRPDRVNSSTLVDDEDVSSALGTIRGGIDGAPIGLIRANLTDPTVRGAQPHRPVILNGRA
jgi:hypothetical protein